jgi:cyanate permease
MRRELRDVQRSLRENVESLSTWIKALNIWAVPVLIALVAALAWVQRMRARRAAAAPA